MRQNRDLIIKDISISGKDMGSVSMSGLMGGLTKEFFSGDKVMMQVALLGLKAKQVNLKVEEKALSPTRSKFMPKKKICRKTKYAARCL